MPTETQKQFKKQMKELEKEMQNKQQEQFFSYIENDHIESYYKPKRKRVIGISVGSIISILVIIYCIYSWTQPLIRAVKHDNSPLYSQENSTKPTGRQKVIDDYIQSINSFEQESNTQYTSIIDQLNQIIKQKDINSEFLEKTINMNSNMQQMLNDIMKMSVPSDAVHFHNIFIQKYKLKINIVNKSNLFASTKNNKYANEINLLIGQINNLNEQQKSFMLDMFDKSGIKYQENEGNIRYWYTN